LEFVSPAEELTAFLLIPILSISIFLLVAFIEILNKYDEILFITKNHSYNKNDFLIPGIIAIFIFLLFYGVFWHLENFFNSLPVNDYDCGLNSICHNKTLADQETRKEIIKLITFWENAP